MTEGLFAPPHASLPELEAGLSTIRSSPSNDGAIQMIVRRPATGSRETLAEGVFDSGAGLIGDNWQRAAGSAGRPPDSGRQLNIMNSRVIALVAGERARWPLAGDQLFVDLNLSYANLPPGSRLAIGEVIIEVTAPVHLGCSKFRAHFGGDAMTFVNSAVGRELNLRGICARVVQAGRIRLGDRAQKITPP